MQTFLFLEEKLFGAELKREKCLKYCVNLNSLFSTFLEGFKPLRLTQKSAKQEKSAIFDLKICQLFSLFLATEEDTVGHIFICKYPKCERRYVHYIS